MDPNRSLTTQLEAARTAALAVPAEDLETVVVKGADRLSWLNGLVTSDLANLSKKDAPEASYGLIVRRNGRILADALILFDETRALVAVPRATLSDVRGHFDHYLVMEDAEVGQTPGAFDIWLIHGPASGEVLLAARREGGLGGLVDRTGLGGAVVFAPSALTTEVQAAIERALAEKGGCLGDQAGWDALRLETGVPRFGADFDGNVYPQEAVLEKVAVSFNKGCYLGQEVVCMLEMRGHVKRKLALVMMSTTDPLPKGAAVMDDAGTSIGEIMSAALSPTLGKTIAFAMLKRAHTEPGQHVKVAGQGGQVVERPVSRL